MTHIPYDKFNELTKDIINAVVNVNTYKDKDKEELQKDVLTLLYSVLKNERELSDTILYLHRKNK